jgi:uncharacterized protein YjiS (DUF1127 family)
MRSRNGFHDDIALHKSIECPYIQNIGTARCRTEQQQDKGRSTMKLIQSYASWRKYRETCVELNRLSERELSDIGMTRGDIPFAARRAL